MKKTPCTRALEYQPNFLKGETGPARYMSTQDQAQPLAQQAEMQVALRTEVQHPEVLFHSPRLERCGVPGCKAAIAY